MKNDALQDFRHEIDNIRLEHGVQVKNVASESDRFQEGETPTFLPPSRTAEKINERKAMIRWEAKMAARDAKYQIMKIGIFIGLVLVLIGPLYIAMFHHTPGEPDGILMFKSMMGAIPGCVVTMLCAITIDGMHR